jgi:hypothetical protein
MSIETVTATAAHSCETCQSADYVRAELIIKRSGLQPADWGYLLHDIAKALRGELPEIKWQVAAQATSRL